MRKLPRVTYLGDAVYVALTPHGNVMLMTSDGLNISNVVQLEPEIYSAFLEWAEDWTSQDEHLARRLASTRVESMDIGEVFSLATEALVVDYKGDRDRLQDDAKTHGPDCDHPACRADWIDTGDAVCLKEEVPDVDPQSHSAMKEDRRNP